MPTGEFNWDLSNLYTTGEINVAPPTLPDYDTSGFADQGDLDLAQLYWGDELTNPVGARWYNNLPDGAVGQEELDMVLLNWGNRIAPLGGAAIPEPAAVVHVLTLLVCIASTRIARHTVR